MSTFFELDRIYRPALARQPRNKLFHSKTRPALARQKLENATGRKNPVWARVWARDNQDMIFFCLSACPPSRARPALRGFSRGGQADQARPPAKWSEADGRGGRGRKAKSPIFSIQSILPAPINEPPYLTGVDPVGQEIGKRPFSMN